MPLSCTTPSLLGFVGFIILERFGSQEKDNCAKRYLALPPCHTLGKKVKCRFPGLLPILHADGASATVPEQKCQLSDDLEHKLTSMETMLSRLGMILDSV